MPLKLMSLKMAIDYKVMKALRKKNEKGLSERKQSISAQT
jgi:hypothetical protein